MEEKKGPLDYSAPQQQIKLVREKYVKPAKEKSRLCRPDASVTKHGIIVSLIVRTVSTLIVGFGM